MGGVYCPTCEAGVEVTAKFCLSCGHNLTQQGPITATGHDLNQLKDVIRLREDLSMAEKFDMIARVEDGADPIALGIAAAADDDGTADETVSLPAASEVAPALQSAQWNDAAADAAVELAMADSKLLDLKNAGAFEKLDKQFTGAMDLGRNATLELLKVSQGLLLPANDALQAVPVMQPPNKAFCPKCGSDIHANAMLQWRKWSDASTHLLTIQLEAAMRSSLMHLAASYRDKIQDLEDQLTDAKKAIEKAKEEAASAPAPKQEKKPAKEKKSTGKAAATTKAAPAKSKPAPSKPKTGGLFGAKKPKKTYEGEPGGKAEWFLEEALDTVYDPHGTGKPVKAAMILARSAEGNVRVRDVIRVYAVEGEDGISELAWTSPLTKYLIEAYDAC
ncbi:MAG: zinc ribbon domain-containing protein [Candidatus Thermoplasmatota archaeon]|nr:zinc ribbon domain-containing protein [Candidatus Thermoplasmatota archaeon]MEC8341162.1 zinc ribbon domain-containing protein [Candidatus Thermoplasmatota archaeon]MEC8576781.1 zinc ribbon domain-containing protein [Candidatus Thermoplasmatota archaeon]MEC8779624.1 zinc ribbon domain-containing protein [Candidatus Thermoplasmatota archaeon]MEC8817139.1 zinc ribbon domain-containing protein [Candidatus Thermoplasmatota archaeon]